MKDFEILNLDIPESGGKTVFACGGDIKSRFSFYKGGRFHLSADFGDLSYLDNYLDFSASIEEMIDKLKIAPEIVAYDSHPYYFSSKAVRLFKNARQVIVQHQHAHIASAMACASVREPVIGVGFDGSGYGNDGNIWGGEFLIVSPGRYVRRAHLDYIKMPGAEIAVRQTWRMAFSLLYSVFGDNVFGLELPLFKVIGREKLTFIKKMLDSNINSPLTSSCGRFFDAISAILGIRQLANFEAEPAISLEEKAAQAEDSESFPFEIRQEGSMYVVKYAVFLKELLRGLNDHMPTATIARRFHNSVGRMIADVVRLISSECGIRKVVLSGGVFQNGILKQAAIEYLAREGFSVVGEDCAPVHDLGICIGQTFVALTGSGYHGLKEAEYVPGDTGISM